MLEYTKWLMGFNYEQGDRSEEEVRGVQNTNGAEEIQRATGRYGFLGEAKALLPFVREHKGRYIEIGLVLAGQEISEEELRVLWNREETTSASHRRGLEEPRSGEPTDSLCVVPSIYPSYGTEAWQNGTWESTIPRVATGIKNRVDRLKAIGNGQVPIVAATAWRLLTGETS